MLTHLCHPVLDLTGIQCLGLAGSFWVSALKQPPEPSLLGSVCPVRVWMFPHPFLALGAGGEITGQLNPRWGHNDIRLWQIVSELCVW